MSLALVHIGMMKAGSTWLHKWLTAHPELAAPFDKRQDERPGKNCYFWNRDDPHGRHPRRARDPMYTLKEYRAAVDSVPKAIDVTDSYSFMPLESIEALKAEHPDVVVTYCVRTPLAALWSYMRMHSLEVDDLLMHPRALLNARVDQNLACWNEAGFWPRIIRFEDIKADPLGVLRQFAQWLDIDPTWWDAHKAELYEPVNECARPEVLTHAMSLQLARLINGRARAA